MGQELVADGQYLAIFNSTHRVLKAERLIKSKGINIMLIPAPRAVQTDCGLAIRFDQTQQTAVMDLLTKQNLLPAFVCRLENGTYRTLQEFPHENH